MDTLFEKIKHSLARCTAPSEHDSILLNGQEFPIDKSQFRPIEQKQASGTITFIDGGQAELLKAPNFSLQFIRIYACTFKDKTKATQHKHEFFLLATAQGGADITYQADLFPLQNEKIIAESDLAFNSMDPTIRTGTERADISRIGGVARRFAELVLASRLATETGTAILDGTLEQTLGKEQNYLAKLPGNVAALAKTTSIFTAKGNSAAALLNNLGPAATWHYQVTQEKQRTISFVKLHHQSDYVFRFETLGNSDVLPLLAAHSTDPVFLGYPYGLIWADQNARVSNQEAAMLKTQFLLKLGKDAKKIKKYLNAANAHDILDHIK